VVGSSVVYHVTRDSRAGTMPSYCSKGYPCFRVPTLTRVIKKKHSTSLSDRLRERKGWHRPAFVASSTGSRFLGTEPRETNHCVHLC
jgi:hypothetical protein